MTGSHDKTRSFPAGWIGLALQILLLSGSHGWAQDGSFTNLLARGEAAAAGGHLAAATAIYQSAQLAAASNSAGLCALARRYCDLMYLTNSARIQKDLLGQALACSVRAVAVDSSNATAHACAAVCHAKDCAFVDLKTRLNDTRLFKQEAETAIALDPGQDIAYYLLGRWNYGVANVGALARAFVKVVYGGLPPASNEAAIADFQKAIALAPGRVMHHAALAMVYETTGQKDLEVTELKKCRNLKPTGLEDAEAQQDALRKLTRLAQ